MGQQRWQRLATGGLPCSADFIPVVVAQHTLAQVSRTYGRAGDGPPP